MIQKSRVLIFAFSIIFSAVNAQQNVDVSDLKTLNNWMSGTFDSEEQAKNDTDFFKPRLRIRKLKG